MIIIGVNMFYFLVSSINTNISNREIHSKETQKKLFLLYNQMKKFKIPLGIIKRAQKAILSGKRRLADVNLFPANFKKSIRVELEYFRYLPILKEFQIFKFLRKDILATLGKHLTEASFHESMRPLIQTRLFTARGTPPSISTWSWRASWKCTTEDPTGSPVEFTPPARFLAKLSC